MPAIYCADTYCDSCADVIREELKANATPEQLEEWGDECNYDSDDFPKYMGDDEESDSPCHCCCGGDCLEYEELSDGSRIGALLSTNLTTDGIEYVKDVVADGGAVAEFWRVQFDYIDFPETEPEDDDYKLSPCGALGGKTAVTQFAELLGEFTDTSEALEFVAKHMDSERFWPNIWWISDHGNCWQIDIDGNEIN